tara:strand:+ start:9838 stop:10917 length:1080 start_codon:yes stop_codon:yes gene_type:complete
MQKKPLNSTHCFIIAEAGVNHNGDISIAKRLIDAAVSANVDAVKFQTFKAENIVIKTAEKAEYQIKNMNSNESQFQMLKKLELSDSRHKELFDHCAEKKIKFMSTPFDEESVDMLDDLGMNIFKIPSGEITNKTFIQHVASKKKPVILSTGMSYLEEVERAIGWIKGVDGWARKWADTKNHITPFSHKTISPLTLLHCTSNYPAAIEDINLLAMKTMKKKFDLPVGYSDHSMGIDVPIAAVALGAIVLEKHFTLDRNMVGPDHKASLEPDELESMVRGIRNIGKAMGNGIKKPLENEEKIKNLVRKSIVSATDIKAGKIFTKENTVIKRPGTGIPPAEWTSVIGRKAKRDFQEDELIEI